MTKKFAVTMHLTRGQIHTLRGIVAGVSVTSHDQSVKRLCDIVKACCVDPPETQPDRCERCGRRQ